ncbi:hypothetical protein DUNSADRAFT_18371, partial [Dunaliella salina]
MEFLAEAFPYTGGSVNREPGLQVRELNLGTYRSQWRFDVANECRDVVNVPAPYCSVDCGSVDFCGTNTSALGMGSLGHCCELALFDQSYRWRHEDDGIYHSMPGWQIRNYGRDEYIKDELRQLSYCNSKKFYDEFYD